MVLYVIKEFMKGTNQKMALGKEDTKGKVKMILLSEENTVYEIDRECYERLMRQKVKGKIKKAAISQLFYSLMGRQEFSIYNT